MNLSTGAMIALVAAGTFLTVILICAMIWCLKQYKPHSYVTSTPEESDQAMFRHTIVSYKSRDGAPGFTAVMPLVTLQERGHRNEGGC